MARLTRKETHAQTRARLVETATRLFLADGFNATSLERVATEAGYSKGAVYSNFATKHELGLAVLDAVHATRAQTLAATVATVTTADARVEAFADWAERNIGDVGWTALEVEFATSTRHVPGISGELAARRRTVTDGVAALLELQAAELGIALRVPAADAAVHLLALGIGLGVQRAFDPDLPVTSLVDQLRAMLTGG
ncbi:MAG TPA: TetR/AcrR family transcriptional regulator [Nocardioides sp.]|nr:TetR/AcrR family transcriptional regulator [Nocardioides sp.]